MQTCCSCAMAQDPGADAFGFELPLLLFRIVGVPWQGKGQRLQQTCKAESKQRRNGHRLSMQRTAMQKLTWT